MIFSSSGFSPDMWEHIYLAKEFVSCRAINIWERGMQGELSKLHTCFVFQHDPSMDPLDFRTSEGFSPAYVFLEPDSIDINESPTPNITKVYWFWPTIIQVLMPILLNHCFPMMNSACLNSLSLYSFQKKTGACAGAADHLLPWPIQKIFSARAWSWFARNFSGWCFEDLWSCRRTTPEINSHCD